METETVMEMEMEKERDEETWPTCEAESSKECLVMFVCKASLVVEACGEGLVQLDLRPCALARQRFAASGSAVQ